MGRGGRASGTSSRTSHGFSATDDGREGEEEGMLPDLPIQGSVEIAKRLWRLALAYFPHCSQLRTTEPSEPAARTHPCRPGNFAR